MSASRQGPDAGASSPGGDLLRDAGVADDETSPAALLPLAGRSAEIDRAVVARLARAPSEEGARALRAIETAAGGRGWKHVVKDARRALYRFAQRGIALPPEAVPEPPPRRLAGSALEGYVSAVDGRGDQLVWLVRPQREGGLVMLTGIVNEPEGLRDVALAQLTRKQLKQMEADLRQRHGMRLVPADGEHCDARLVEAYERARARQVTGIGEFPAHRARLVTRPAPPLGPPLITRVAPAAADEAALAARGAALLEEVELATWVLDRGVLEPYLADIAAARESPLLLSPPQQQERVDAVIRRALRELFDAAGVATYRRRLEEIAYYLYATGRKDLGLVAAATAAALARATHGGEGIPFFETLVRSSIALYVNEDAARAEEAARGSLLVKPGAPMSPQTPRRFPPTTT